MINRTFYDVRTANGIVHLTITPINQLLSDGDYFSTGVYKLSDGVVGMGDIIFDSDMVNWRYNGIDELTYDEATLVADFIRNYKDPEGADPDRLT